MKIAYIITPFASISGDSNGIKSQARTWKSGLSLEGHTVDEISPWGNYNWKHYDLIHIFGTGLWLPFLVDRIKKLNSNIVISPIIDSVQSPLLYKFSSYMGFKGFRLWSPTYALRDSLSSIKAVFVRSEYESRYFSYSLNVSDRKIFKIPLSYSVEVPSTSISKEDFCLHISSIYQKRKNVIRLIRAAKKFNFRLVLAGSTGSEEEFRPIKEEIGDATNIEVLGFISEETKLDLYSKAKVFALPSLWEGVGIVALDAAVFGCKIVITKNGGPKEYYNGMAEVVDPLDIDSIGTSILKLLNENGNQSRLKQLISVDYSPKSTISLLVNSYSNL